MLHDVHLEGAQVELHELCEDDASDDYAGWLNDPVVNQYLETRSVTIQDLKDFIHDKNADEGALLLGIFCKRTKKHIGNVKLEPIERKKKKATIGLLIGDKKYWGKGIGTEVTNVVTQFAFDVLGLEEVNLGVIAENKPAIRVYEKCGFTIDRTNKGAIRHGNTLHDQVIMRRYASVRQ
ncbi:GNAT family N-acetyltransferase [Candidatus Peregrinibacteria bacterium]|nr:GNAT family N-acetyltransferase [Candidatus Peregrinibacteria bacterium]